MAVLARDHVLAAADANTETVAVPEWGGSVVVRSMTAGDRDKFDAMVASTKNVGYSGVRVWTVLACCVDDSGNKLFRTEDEPALRLKSAAVIERIFEAALRVSGITGSEQLEKN